VIRRLRGIASSRKSVASATLLAFDVLQLDGIDLRGLPLIERKLRLRKLLARRSDGVQLVEHLEGDGAMIFEHACRLGLEGIVCKRTDSPYRAGPSKTWLKVKNRAHPSIGRMRDATEAGFRRRY
jgi:bifunctional non-homologous end joining protein LigD